jgi:hypothetical protein
MIPVGLCTTLPDDRKFQDADGTAGVEPPKSSTFEVGDIYGPTPLPWPTLVTNPLKTREASP